MNGTPGRKSVREFQRSCGFVCALCSFVALSPCASGVSALLKEDVTFPPETFLLWVEL
jgi:hypothetical protein